jgi:spermidine/putrescine transport system permease protein
VSSDTVLRLAVLGFVAAFFSYLFGPLIVMGLSAFNSSAFPRVMPWECFTVEWFDVLVHDAALMRGLRNSLVIGLGVVLLAVPTGLAGALLLTQVSARARPWYYTIVISPILIPGVVLGISTLVFWDRLGRMFNASYDSVFYDGIFLSIVGQSTFVSAYAMLVFISRLQRFDPAQEEAALDLGASHVQSFRKVLLPFLKPAIGSAAVLAFLASFENYNTTVFTIVSEATLTTVLASKVRYGINPSISALAVAIVVFTVFFAALHEILKRREARAQAAAQRVAAGGTWRGPARRGVFAEPAVYILLAVFIAGLGTTWFAGTVGVDECKARVAQDKRERTERAIQQRKAREMFKGAAPGVQPPPAAAPTAPRSEQAPGTEGYRGMFAPENLKKQAGEDAAPK